MATILASSCSQVVSEIEAIKMNNRGLIELNSGRHKEAINLFQEAIVSKSLSTNTRSTIYRNIAQVYMDMQVQDSAIHYSTLAATCYPTNTYDFLVNMADVHILKGKINPAINTLNKAYKMKPNDLAVNNSLGLIYLGEYDYEYMDVEKALPFNKKAFEINQDRNTEYVLAKNYFELGRFSDAEVHFKNLYIQYPENLDHAMFLGMTKYQLNNKKQAEELWNEVLAVDSSYLWIIESYKEEL